MKKKQFNVRLKPSLHARCKHWIEQMEWKNDELGEVAFETLFGTLDAEIRARAAKLRQKMKEASSVQSAQAGIPDHHAVGLRRPARGSARPGGGGGLTQKAILD